ncbi:MAG: exported protein of unknown function [Candidatus Nomurabacteria bacterium]|nr:exported protein of unknown function [Candidatus Nomurabacteria bacterium]
MSPLLHMLPPRIFSSFLVAFCIAFFGMGVHAHATTISPARIEVAGDPGTVLKGTVTLINDQANTQTFYASYENFSAQGDNGTPVFSAEKKGLDTWILATPDQVTVPAGKSVEVPYTITIPSNAVPGGYFAALFWSTVPPVTLPTQQLSIGAKIGSLVLLRVNGDIAESGGATSFERSDHGFFYTELPVAMNYIFQNSGADRVMPKGAVTIRNTFFIKSTSINANASIGNVLPKSARQFSVAWAPTHNDQPAGFFQHVAYQWHNFAFGLYSAHLSLAYGMQGMQSTKTLWFFILPWQLLICVAMVLAALYAIGKLLIVRYNQYIIRSTQPRNVDHS